MAEYNPSKIIKDGNTYNFRDTTKIPLAGSNEISGSLIPSTDGAVNLGSSSYQWNNAYIKSLTINGTQFLPSDYVTLSSLSTVATSGSYNDLSNKPTIPTVNNGTLTIQKNGDTVGTFSANQATDETINITVPDVNNGTLTIQQNGTTVDTFTANSSSDKTVNIQCVDLNSNQTVGGIKKFSNAPVVGSINLDGKTIDTDANGNMAFDSHIVDTIEEQGDGYIRYSNGIQICWGSINFISACNSPWGSLYESDTVSGSYAKSFVENPAVSISGNIGSFASIIESSNGTNTSTPSIWLCRTTAVNETLSCTARYIAIGRWK